MKRFVLPIVIMAFFLAGCAANSPRIQTEALASIEKLGGHVTVDEKAPGRPVIGVNFSDVAITDAALACLDAFPDLQSLDLGHTQKPGHATITDTGLAHLRKLGQLRSLSLAGTEVTDAGLVHLHGLTHLQSLNLDGTKVTDAGVERLGKMTGLQGLKLRDTKVTDAGLEHLAGLKQLQTLNLGGTEVTGPGVKKLRRALPDCQIRRN